MCLKWLVSACQDFWSYAEASAVDKESIYRVIVRTETATKAVIVTLPEMVQAWNLENTKVLNISEIAENSCNFYCTNI